MRSTCRAGSTATAAPGSASVEGVRADLTVTFLGDKPGLHTGAGCDAAGEVQVDRLGVEAGSSALTLAAPDDFAAVAVRRRRDTHKGSFGNVLVIGGGPGMVGAPLLAARAALRLGAGRVYVDCIGAPELRVDPVQPELMFRPHTSVADPECVVVGCGLGVDDPARSALAWSLARPRAIVIDADGLNLLADEPAFRDGAARAHGAIGADAAPARSGTTAEDLRPRGPGGPARALRERSPANGARSSSSRAPAP